MCGFKWLNNGKKQSIGSDTQSEIIRLSTGIPLSGEFFDCCVLHFRKRSASH